MSMIEWAENEVKLACAREKRNAKNDERDYGVACYESALKAYKCLCGDGHSGMSIGITQSILNRLIDGRPLTPIEDTDDNWNMCSHGGDKKTIYQCRRMSSLFKDVYPDGTFKYHDVDRFRCYNVHNPNIPYYSGLVARLIDEMLPITMPYCPDGTIKVYCNDFLTDRRNGDFDTVAVYHAIKPDGTKLDITRFFKCDEWIDDDWVEIDNVEYTTRLIHSKELNNE